VTDERVCCENIAGGNVYNCERDEGRPLVTVLQEMVANQCMLLCLKDKVVSDIPKRRCKSSGNCTRDDRKGTIDEASKTVQMMSEPSLFCQTWDKSGRDLFTVRVASGVKIA